MVVIDRDGPEGLVENWGMVTLKNAGGTILGPCHGCQAIFARYGLTDAAIADDRGPGQAI